MIWHVYQRARQSKLARTVIATDDTRILDECHGLGCEAVMTSAKHHTGTERMAEVAAQIGAEFYVNIQGDEPLIVPKLLDDLVSVLANADDVPIATARRRIQDDMTLVDDPNVVKVVTDCDGNALYFSRSRIPYDRLRGSNGEVNRRVSYYQHVGVYAFRRSALLSFASLPPSPLEEAESLEQLRALENGWRIRVVDTEYQGIGVDVPDDIQRVERLLAVSGQV
jgi:3-deoxy-manno-octulosonate cytidylyltransferase (CMP-KDO synthetase)